MNLQELLTSHSLTGEQQNQIAEVTKIFLEAADKLIKIVPNNPFQAKVNADLLSAKMFTVLALSQPKVK